MSAPSAQGTAQKINPARDIPFEWWILFHSSQLDALIKRAFKTHPDVESASAALRKAQEYAAAQHGFFYPAVEAGEHAGQQTRAAGPKNGSATYYNLHVAQLTAGYVSEVFGANHRPESELTRAARKQLQQEAIRISLASNVVAAAIQEASLREQIAAQLRIVSLNRQALEIARNQLNLGYVSEAEKTQQERRAALAQQALVPLQQQLEQTRDLLHVLTGNAPDQDDDEMFALADLHLQQELPQSLSSKLVAQRPDVRIAEAQLHDAGAHYGVAVVNTMPQFAISGATGGMASSPSWMAKSGGDFFSRTGNAARAIFDRGTLRAKPRAVQQSLVQAGGQYRTVVVAALQNTADALYLIQSDQQALMQATQAAQAASKAGELAQKQYEAGAIDFQTWLVAQQNEQLATIDLVRAQTNRLGDAALLFQALGGGWWNADATEPMAAKKP